MYQRLEGGSGREVYFRAPRLKSTWLAGDAPTFVRFGEYEGKLRDLSLGGFLVELPGVNENTSLCGVDEWVEVRVQDNVIFSARGRVVRCEPLRRGGARVGLNILDCPAEPRELRRRARAVGFQSGLQGGLREYEAVSPAYSTAVSKVALLLAHWRRLLNRREGEIAEDFDKEKTAAELHRLEANAEIRIRDEWAAVRAEAIAVANAACGDLGDLQAAKKLTETVVTSALLDAPIWRQAYVKPRGYPGDFELMNFMYDDARQGSSVFARIMHQLGREERLAATVRDRRHFLCKQLLLEAKRTATDRRKRLTILNLGSGPAGEVEDLLRRDPGELKLVVTLVDQDKDALEYADRRLRLGERSVLGQSSQLDLRCRYLSFRDLFRDQELLREFSGQDVIYSAGFFDYLPDGIARALIGILYSLLSPGGRMLIGNAVDALDVKWVPEFVLDWKMNYRSEQDMMTLCAGLDLSAPAKVILDRSGAWQFLSIERAA